MLYQGGLARAGVADNAEIFSLLSGKVDLVECDMLKRSPGGIDMG